MTASATLVVATLALGLGTFAFRAAGPALSARVELPERVERLMSDASVVLLVALVATATLLDGREPAGVARLAGVAVAGVLAWRRAPFLLVVLAAAATAAGLRWLGWAA